MSKERDQRWDATGQESVVKYEMFEVRDHTSNFKDASS